MFDDQKGNIDSKCAKSMVFWLKKRPSRKLDESAPTNMLRPKKNVVVSGKIN